MRTPSAPDPDIPWRRIAERFASLATRIEDHQPLEGLMEELTRIQALCDEVIAREPQAEANAFAGNVQLAVRTWQQVWPRLGTQGPFRQAVMREARMWSKRFLERGLPRHAGEMASASEPEGGRSGRTHRRAAA